MAHHTLVPNIWCNGDAEALVAFYSTVFPEVTVHQTLHYPQHGLPHFQEHMAGKILTIDFSIMGARFIAINAGPDFHANPSLSFMVSITPEISDDPRTLVTTLWDALVAEGSVLMPLGEYPFSEHYGWVEDRFGVSWQLMAHTTTPTSRHAATPPRPTIMPALMFGAHHVNQAEEAITHYMSVFPNSQLGEIARYSHPQGPADAGSLMYCDAVLNGSWISVMDAGVDQDFTFTEGVSLLVECSTQEEIDHYWAGLSHRPEAEQCGWCQDQFGVSWQIAPPATPEDVEDLGAYQAMMSMKKIHLQQLRDARGSAG